MPLNYKFKLIKYSIPKQKHLLEVYFKVKFIELMDTLEYYRKNSDNNKKKQENKKVRPHVTKTTGGKKINQKANTIHFSFPFSESRKGCYLYIYTKISQ